MKTKIFLSYSHADKRVAQQLERALCHMEIAEVWRDERQIKYTDRIDAYMDKIRESDFAIIIISDTFLRSPNCMNEILQFFKDKNASERLLPIVINSKKNGAKIYSSTDIISYIKYWEEKTEQLAKEISTVKISNIADLHRQLNRYELIAQTIAEFLDLLRNTYFTNIDKLKKTNYADIVKKVTGLDIDALAMNKAKMFYSKAQYEFKLQKKIKWLSDALELNPNHILALKDRGIAYDTSGDHELAVIDFTKAIELDPEQYIFFLNKGLALTNLRRYDEALDNLFQANKLNPNDAMPYNNIADVYRKKGEYEKAKKYINKAFEVDPTEDLIWSTSSEIKACEGDHVGFYNDMSKAIELGFPLFRYLDDAVYKPYTDDDNFKILVEKSRVNDRFI